MCEIEHNFRRRREGGRERETTTDVRQHQLSSLEARLMPSLSRSGNVYTIYTTLLDSLIGDVYLMFGCVKEKREDGNTRLSSLDIQQTQ